jgi:hypothetical protein
VSQRDVPRRLIQCKRSAPNRENLIDWLKQPFSRRHRYDELSEFERLVIARSAESQENHGIESWSPALVSPDESTNISLLS